MNTIQEVFDHVAGHLIKQGRQSKIGSYEYDGCSYRGIGGTSCAVGCLIPDNEYKFEFEGMSFTEIAEHEYVPTLNKLLEDANGDADNLMSMLTELQIFHDDSRNWGCDGINNQGLKMLYKIANDHGLLEKEYIQQDCEMNSGNR